MTTATATPTPPSFNFKKLDTTKASEADFENTFKTGEESKHLKPGHHTVQVVRVEFTKVNETDSNWANFCIYYANAEGKECRDYVQVPMASTDTGAMVKYVKNGKDVPFIASKFRSVMSGLGFQLSLGNWQAATEKAFGKPANLVGKTVEIDIGYKGNHIKFIGFDSEKNKQYQLVDKNDVPLDETIFADFNSAEAQYNINPEGKFKGNLEKYSNIVKYYPRLENASEPTAKPGLPF